MPGFIPRKISPENSPGEKLRQGRQAKKLRIEEVSRLINIQSKYLIALEEERWDQLPSGLYGKNFLKKYAQFLGLDFKELLKDFYAEYEDYGSQEDPFSKKVIKSNKFLVFPKIAKNIMIGFLVLICFLYLIFYFRNIISTPALTITQPTQNLLTSSTVITVIGRTNPQANVTINQQNIIKDNKGYFSQNVNLKKGLNILTIKAQKKYSRAKTVSLEILVQ